MCTTQSQSHREFRNKDTYAGRLVQAEMARPPYAHHAQRLAGAAQGSVASGPRLLWIPPVLQLEALSSQHPPTFPGCQSPDPLDHIGSGSSASRLPVGRLSEGRLRRGRLVGQSTAPLAAFGLRAANDTHPLPPPLSI